METIASYKHDVDQMAETLPFGDDVPDYGEQLKELVAKKEEAEANYNEAMKKQIALKGTRLTDSSTNLAAAIAKRREDFDKKVDILREESMEQDNKIAQTCEVNCAKIRIEAGPIIEQLATEMAVVGEKDANSEKVRIGREYVKEGQEIIKTLQGGADDLTEQLKALAGIKKDLLGALPIKGLEIIDGDICLDGVLFDHVNEAKRIQFVLDVAGIRETELPLVCVDGLEALDPEHFELFCAAALKTEMQFFVTRVTDDNKMTVNNLNGKEKKSHAKRSVGQ